MIQIRAQIRTRLLAVAAITKPKRKVFQVRFQNFHEYAGSNPKNELKLIHSRRMANAQNMGPAGTVLRSRDRSQAPSATIARMKFMGAVCANPYVSWCGCSSANHDHRSTPT